MFEALIVLEVVALLVEWYISKLKDNNIKIN